MINPLSTEELNRLNTFIENNLGLLDKGEYNIERWKARERMIQLLSCSGVMKEDFKEKIYIPFLKEGEKTPAETVIIQDDDNLDFYVNAFRGERSRSHGKQWSDAVETIQRKKQQGWEIRSIFTPSDSVVVNQNLNAKQWNHINSVRGYSSDCGYKKTRTWFHGTKYEGWQDPSAYCPHEVSHKSNYALVGGVAVACAGALYLYKNI